MNEMPSRQAEAASSAGSAGLETAIGRFAGLTVLVAGDLILDRFVHGVIERISPEAPIPVLHGRSETAALGGAGNVVANLVSLGAKVLPVGAVGDDMAGREILRMLKADGIDVGGIVVAGGRRTSCKSRFVALNQQVLRYDEEEIRPLAAEQRATLVGLFARLAAAADIVILSDYGKGVLIDGVAAELIAAGRAAGKRVIVDPKGHDYSAYRGATAVTPNRKELGEAVGRPVSAEREIVAAARTLISRYGFDYVLATRSEEGMSVVGAAEAVHIPTAAREVFDVSGAGDTAVASFALALAARLGREDAARLANAAAGVVVGKRGTARLQPYELVEAVRRAEHAPHVSALVDAATAGGIVAAWKREGLAVGFTNGCFDILHAGHVALLSRARAACDRLVLGLNSDASVRRLKGEGRPINNEHDRAAVLAALSAVDLVVLFSEDTPLELITALKPDVLVKGADYTIDTVVGADVVQAAGGRVVLADLVAGKSTTGILKAMRDR